LSQSTSLTDGRTDGQMDRILIARPRLHSMQLGKNRLFVIQQRYICLCTIYVSVPKPVRTATYSYIATLDQWRRKVF